MRMLIIFCAACCLLCTSVHRPKTSHKPCYLSPHRLSTGRNLAPFCAIGGLYLFCLWDNLFAISVMDTFLKICFNNFLTVKLVFSDCSVSLFLRLLGKNNIQIPVKKPPAEVTRKPGHQAPIQSEDDTLVAVMKLVGTFSSCPAITNPKT